MIGGARHGHMNLIVEDWRALAAFYEQQFGCTPVPPERGESRLRGELLHGVEAIEVGDLVEDRHT